MADPFLGEIRAFPFSFAPKGWAMCNGQLLPLSQNTALFALLGTVYGGDGKSTFALPDLQGSSPMHAGQGQGLSLRDIGEIGGVENVTLLITEMPAHTHLQQGCDADGTTAAPAGELPAKGLWDTGVAGGIVGAYSALAPNVQMNPVALAQTMGDQPHNNMQPYLTLNYCIALQGMSRSVLERRL